MVKINKSTVETAKTVIIAVLITGVVAFIGGVKYQANMNASTQAAIKAATTSTHTNQTASK